MRLSSTIFSSSLIYNCSLLCLCSRKRRRLKTDYLVEYLLSDGAIISWGQSYFLSMQFAVDWIKECLPVNHPRTVLVTVPPYCWEGGKKDTPFLLIAFHQICALGVRGLTHVHRESVIHPKRARKGTSKQSSYSILRVESDFTLAHCKEYLFPFSLQGTLILFCITQSS